MSHFASLAFTLGFAVLLAAIHALGPRLRPISPLESAAGASLSGGLAAGYVFVHLLPELARGNQDVASKLGHDLPDTALQDVATFLVALLGFFVFFVLQWAAEQAGRDGREPSRTVFTAHLVGFAVYNALVVFTVPLRFRTGAGLAFFYCAILTLHLASTDRLMREQFPRRFGGNVRARIVLSAGALAGWLLALVVPEGTVSLTMLTAFLAGAILLNVLDQDLPARHEARIGWFATGLAISAVVLTAIAAAGEHGGA